MGEVIPIKKEPRIGCPIVYKSERRPAWQIYLIVGLWGLAALCLWPFVYLYLLLTDDARTFYHQGIASRTSEITLTAVALVCWGVAAYGIYTHHWVFSAAAAILFLWTTLFRYHPENKEV